MQSVTCALVMLTSRREIDRLRDSWTRLVERFSGNRPKAFDNNQLYGKLFTVVSARLVAPTSCSRPAGLMPRVIHSMPFGA